MSDTILEILAGHVASRRGATARINDIDRSVARRMLTDSRIVVLEASKPDHADENGDHWMENTVSTDGTLVTLHHPRNRETLDAEETLAFAGVLASASRRTKS